MKLRLLIFALAVAASCGCSTTDRTTTNKDGTQTHSKQSSLFIQVQGYDDSIDANGAQHTSIANYSTDAQGIIATDNLLNHLLQNIALFVAVAGNGTNGPNTNTVAILMQRQQQDQPKGITASRHLYAPK